MIVNMKLHDWRQYSSREEVLIAQSAAATQLGRDLFKKHGPPDQVGRTRYHIGLVMFGLPLLFGWLGPYVTHRIPEYETSRFWISLAGDVMFVSSLFVLGGDFWDKLRSLFIHRAKAQIPSK